MPIGPPNKAANITNKALLSLNFEIVVRSSPFIPCKSVKYKAENRSWKKARSNDAATKRLSTNENGTASNTHPLKAVSAPHSSPDNKPLKIPLR